MKLISLKGAALTLLLGAASFSTAPAAEAKAAPAPVSASPASSPVPTEAALKAKLHQGLLIPGVSLSEGVSQITGVAISPLLGVTAMGAWTYYHTAPEMRDRLPWYCHPYAWGFGMALLGVCFLKDFLGTATPALVKKPLDFAELFEDKLSALVASAAFVPLVAIAISQMEKLTPQAMEGAAASGMAMAPIASMLDFTMHTPWISIPVAIAAFGVVWLSSHAINVLIALSPFGIVDAGLKMTKLALLTVVVGSSTINPYFGAIVSMVIILIGLILAGWSFRLTVFGTLMGADFLLNKRATKADLDTGVRGFLARRTNGVPVRTLGKLERDASGTTHFVWKPWILLPSRRTALNDEGLVLCRGLLHPSVSHRPDRDARPRHAIILLPRYRRLEETIAQRFGCQEVVDSALIRGFKAIRQWLVEALSSGKNLIEARGT